MSRDPRGPLVEIINVECPNGDAFLTLICGHRSQVASHFSYKVGAKTHCFQCRKENEKPIFRGYNRDQLSDAFDCVADKSNWKLPIVDKTIWHADRDAVAAAVVFFAGCEPTFTAHPQKPNFLIVNAPGYYVAVGA